MAKPYFSSFFSNFLSFLLLLLHLGCFNFSSKFSNHSKKLKPLSSSPSSLKSRKPLSSTWSFLKHVFCSKTSKRISPPMGLTSARSSHQSLVSLVPQEQAVQPVLQDQVKKAHQDSDVAAINDHQLFPLRNDIFPCTNCGEVFQKPLLLEQHQAVKHAVSELYEGDSGKNIVHIIFKTGWPCKEKNPEIQRILKIHNSPKILSRFEEYREYVKAKASRNTRRRDERCIADGNELLRFYCSTFICELGQNGDTTLCTQQYCSICGIIKSGFSQKMDGISTLSSSWRAHCGVPADVEEEFKFLNVKRAMLVCRVVAGRVGCELDPAEDDKENGGFDSVGGGRNGGIMSGGLSRVDEEELLVFNPRAVLPCFVIVYTV